MRTACSLPPSHYSMSTTPPLCSTVLCLHIPCALWHWCDSCLCLILHCVCSFKPLSAALSEPGEFLMSDFAKFERPALLHVGFQAVDAFTTEKGHAPRPANSDDADRVIQLAKVRATDVTHPSRQAAV